MCNASGCISADDLVMQKYWAAKYQRKHTSLLQLHNQPCMDGHGASDAPCTSLNKFTMLSVHINVLVISVYDSYAYKVCREGLQNLLKKCNTTCNWHRRYRPCSSEMLNCIQVPLLPIFITLKQAEILGWRHTKWSLLPKSLAQVFGPKPRKACLASALMVVWEGKLCYRSYFHTCNHQISGTQSEAVSHEVFGGGNHRRRLDLVSNCHVLVRLWKWQLLTQWRHTEQESWGRQAVSV